MVYVVKSKKAAIKIATDRGNDLEVINGKVTIFGIPLDKWPEGKKIAVDKDKGYVSFSYYAIPTAYCDKDSETPEFIKNLYTAIRASCDGVSCKKCPLSLTEPVGCEQLAGWLEERYPEL